jgi:tryptophan synthase alpha subunit
MELQIPFSEPIADGPVILKANQQALANGTTVRPAWISAAGWPGIPDPVFFT